MKNCINFQVITRIESGARFTFDYLLLILSAAIIAAFGLLFNSGVVLTASMLVSPIMGPILAGIFGWVLMDKRIMKLGIKVELFSLLICIIIGFVIGCFICSINIFYKLDGTIDQFPTEEMIQRCELRSLGVGFLVAIPSGVAVAVGVLGGNIGSLVGVAISASLLPPAVNAGILWSSAIFIHSDISPQGHKGNRIGHLVKGRVVLTFSFS